MQEPVIIGKSVAIKNLLAFINKAAKSDANVLLLGETGVGKELAARAIHNLSLRKKSPFIQINCANLNDSLLESELFGHKKGAFTGAFFDKPGLIEEAEGGTFFLDEIADISAYLQAKLLAVIEKKETRRLGDNKYRHLNVRFICATNSDLLDLIAKDKFRKDLFYRINILSFHIQPLRERKEDIPLLATYFLMQNNKKKYNEKKIKKAAQEILMSYDFPGNIRELENIITRAYVLSSTRHISQEDIIFESHTESGNSDAGQILFEKILKNSSNFWEKVHKPFLNRELNRNEVKYIIVKGLSLTKGSYIKLLPLFNTAADIKTYRRFMRFLRTHKLQPK